MRGTADGVGPLVGITTSLLVTVALVALVNQAIGLLPGGWTLQSLLAIPLRPVMWLIGIPWEQSAAAALLMGTKTILNEFVAYLALAGLPGDALDPHSRVIMTYALCGFANLGSLGILVGGLAAMVPERRAEVAQLGMRSVLSGTIATCLSGAVAGVIVGWLSDDGCSSTMGVAGVMKALGPEFERAHGVTLDAEFLPTQLLMRADPRRRARRPGDPDR